MDNIDEELAKPFKEARDCGQRAKKYMDLRHFWY